MRAEQRSDAIRLTHRQFRIVLSRGWWKQNQTLPLLVDEIWAYPRLHLLARRIADALLEPSSKRLVQ